MKNKLKKLLFFLGVFLVMPNFSLAAPPAINNVNGVIVNGQTLTINGNYLSNQNTTNWTIDESAGGFELGPVGGYVGSFENTDGWGPYGGGGYPVFYDNNEKLLGNQSMRADVIGTGKLGAVTYRSYSYENQDMYFRYYFKHPVGYDWPNNYHKQAIIGSAYIQPYNFFNPIKKYMTGYCGDYRNTVDLPSNLYGGELKDGRWYSVEVRRRQGTSFGSSDSFDAHTQVWIDGVEISNFNNSSNDQNEGWGAFQLGLINGDYFSNANSSFWMDGVAVSTSRIYPATIVEIGNNPNYATATKVRQPLQYISDNQIKITVDLAGLGDGPYYLFITNNTQEKNLAFPLNGDTGDTTAPASPTGLVVE